MAKGMTIDLRREAKDFRKWAQQKVAAVGKAMAAKKSTNPIGAIVALYCYVQDGWIALDFNRMKNSNSMATSPRLPGEIFSKGRAGRSSLKLRATRR